MADRGRIQITLRDCTTEVETEHGLRNEMLRDALTGLPNRIAFSERLDGPEADGQAMLETAILVADLDRFSRINDILGQLAGYAPIATIARRLLPATRTRAVLAPSRGHSLGRKWT